MSFNFFIGYTFTVLEAGFALKTQGSLVKGFTPFRAGLAGLIFSLRLRALPSLKLPFFFSCCAAKDTTPSIAPLTSFDFNPNVSATELYAAVAVNAPLAFMAADFGLPFIFQPDVYD